MIASASTFHEVEQDWEWLAKHLLETLGKCISYDMVKCTMYQCKIDVDMLNAIKSVLADVSSVSPSSEQSWGLGLCSDEGLTLEMSANTLFMVFSISTSTLCP